MRRGQREPFELIEVVETFDFGGAVEAAGQSAEPPLPGLASGGFVASERVRIAVLALVAIRFGDVAPDIAFAFAPFDSASLAARLLRALPSIAAGVYLAAAVVLVVRPTARWWCLGLLVAAVDVGLQGVWLTDALGRTDSRFNSYDVVSLVFVVPSLVVLVLGAVAWRRGMQPASASTDLGRVLIDD